MIISASRRTDIPAIYSQWFMNRVRAGWCLVPNPFNAKQVSHVSLSSEDVEVIVFWSKNPTPMLSHLDELDELGLRYYFQFTLNDYPSELEPNIPSLAERVATFCKLSKHLSPLHIVWRYDPIIISNMTDFNFHRDRFENIAEKLQGMTRRVMVSIVDYYQKTERNLSKLEQEGFSFDRQSDSSQYIGAFLSDLANIASNHDMQIFTCAEQIDFTKYGVPPGRCIDDELLRRIWPSSSHYTKDPSQRKECLCVRSKDIGMNDTCIHGCPYCYSTINFKLAQRRWKEHDPHSPAIYGHPDIPPQPTRAQKQMKFLF